MRFVLAILLSACAFADSPARLLETAPIRFEPRAGRPRSERWIARGLNHSISFSARSTDLRIGDRTVRLSFPGQSTRANFEGSNPLAPTNYFTGKRHDSIPTFGRLHRTAVYPGIDVVYYGHGGELEYDFEIAPHANPSAIRMRFDGADKVALNDRGEILLTLGDGSIVQHTPAVYQRRPSGEIVSIPAHYRLDRNGEVRVSMSHYDRNSALVVDPSLGFSAFLYGSNADVGIAIGHDAKGNVYLAGNTYSGDFPITDGALQVNNLTNQDLWVVRLDLTPGASSIAYSTYLGGSAIEALHGMTVDSNGLVYLTGSTDSADFPISANAYQSTISANTHAFVTVVDTSQAGTAGLVYSTFMGGTNFEEGDAIAVSNGKVYVTGYTTSDDFPTVSPTQAARVSGYDAFVSEFDPAQSGSASLLFSTYLGGSGQDLPHAIAVDPTGQIYVAGFTLSADFPTTPLSYQPFYNGGGDGFLTVLNSSLGTISYGTLLGGKFAEDVRRIVIEPGGHVALAGYTLSPDFPISQGAFEPSFQGACTTDPVPACVGTAFLTILDLKAGTPLVAGLVYSTYFGGSGGDVALDLHRDAAGRYVLGGYTYSLDFPITSGAISPTSQASGPDGFLSVIDPTQPASKQLVYSSFVTSPGSQVVYGVDVDASGNILATGFATSNIFPNGAQNPSLGKLSGFVFTLSLN